MAQSLFCDSCGRFISPYYMMYRELEKHNNPEYMKDHMPNVPDLSEYFDQLGKLDVIAARFGVIKTCCRKMIIGSYRKEDIISGTGEKYFESKKVNL